MKIKVIILTLMLAFCCSYGFGEQEGPVKTYHENGKLKSEEFYKDGKLEGPKRLPLVIICCNFL